MNKYAILLAPLLATIGPASAWAQSSADPLVAPVPDRGHWALSLRDDTGGTAERSATESAGTAQPKRSPTLQSVEVMKTGATQKIETKFRGGTSMTEWIDGGQIYVETNGLVSSGEVGPGIVGVTVSRHFFGTDWVGIENRKDPVKLGEVLCDYFEFEGVREIDRARAESQGSDVEAVPVKQAAWIDATTRLPVAVSGPAGTFVYKFMEPPSAPLQLPAQFRAKDQEIKEEVRRQQQEASTR